MQITVSNSGNFALILCKARSGAKRLRLVTCSGWKLPGAARAPRAEELQPKQEKQSDLDIDNSSVSTASPTLRCHRCHRLSIGESYGHSMRPSDTNDVEQTRFWEGEGKKAWQASGKTNKDVNILLLKQALKQLPFCRRYGFVWLWIKDFFFSSIYSSNDFCLTAAVNTKLTTLSSLQDFRVFEGTSEGFWYSSVTWHWYLWAACLSLHF